MELKNNVKIHSMAHPIMFSLVIYITDFDWRFVEYIVHEMCATIGGDGTRADHLQKIMKYNMVSDFTENKVSV